MAAGRARTWFRRIGLATPLAIAAFLAFNWSNLNARFVAHELRSASSDEHREDRARALLRIGPSGFPHVVATLRDGDDPTCRALASALRQHYHERALEPDLARPLLDGMATFADPGREAVMFALPAILQAPDDSLREPSRAAVECALTSSPRAKSLAVKLTARVGLAERIVPLLSDPDAEVREAALTAVGTAGDAVSIGDEDLFRWLNDPDAKVRSICGIVLQSRGRTQEEIDSGRRLTHPSARERLQLLVDLSLEPTRDIGPWLERLGRDPEPAVRAGAVRVACERKLLYAEWADELAKNDPDATVRQVATFHRRKAAGLIAPAGYEK